MLHSNASRSSSTSSRVFSQTLPLIILWVLSAILGLLATLLFNEMGLSLFGFSYAPTLRTFLASAVITYSVLLVFSSFFESPLVGLLILPFAVHFYDITLGWDVAGGAASLGRLLPLFFMAFAMGICTARDRPPVSRAEIMIITLWLIACLLWYVASIDLTPVGGAVLFIDAVLLPLYYFFIKGQLFRNADAPQQIFVAMLGASILLILGTFGTMSVGLSYHSTTNLLATRSVSDTNFVLGYLLLLWPLVFRGSRAFGVWGFAVLFVAFAAMAVLSFSRGAMFVMFPVLLLTFAVLRVSTKQKFKWLLAILALLALVAMTSLDSVTNAWSLRVDPGSFTQLSVVSVSGLAQRLIDEFFNDRVAAIWVPAWKLFVRSPLFGNGFASFEVLGPGFAEAHSMLFHTLAEQGLLGFIFIYGLLLAVFLQSIRLIKETTGRLHGDAIVTLAALVAWFVFNHGVSFGWVLASQKGFQVNAIAPFLILTLFQVQLSSHTHWVRGRVPAKLR